MSLARRLFVSFLAILVLFALNIGVSFWSDRQRGASLIELQAALDGQIRVLEIEHSLNRCLRVTQGLEALSASGSAAFAPEDVSVLNECVADLERRIDELVATARTGADPDLERFQLQATYKNLQPLWRQLYDSVSSGAAPPDFGSAEDLREELARQLLRLQQNEEERVRTARAAFAANENLTQRTSLVSFVLSTLFAAVVAYTFSADLSRRLGRLALGARKIGEGDYEHSIPIPRADELGSLAAAFNDMALRLREALQREAEARQAAEKANQAKSSFLANMSHELRTPLNAILGYTEMLAEEAEDLGQKSFVPDLQRIKSAGTHLLTLINEVLDLSKIEAGKMTLLIEPIDVPELLEEVVATVGPLMQKNRNRLELELRGDPGILKADATKLRQTLFNLLSNASKFTSDGAIVLRVWEDRANALFHFEVADTGIGMTDTQLSRIFDEFTQAELTTAKKYGGTGLGLSISRKFCRLMGGDLIASSRPGQGSTFHLSLPAVVDPSPEAVTSASAPPS